MAFLYERGVWLKDLVTGFTGCVVARMDSLTGCNRYCLQPELDKDGKNQDALWIDEHSLQVDTTKQRVVLERRAEQPPG
jgi:hypothetical protein